MNMDHEMTSLPNRPRRKFTAIDLTLGIGAPIIAYIGSIAAGMGSVQGLILTGFAALTIVTFHTIRVGRRNEPRIPPYTRWVAVLVAVITFTTAWNLYKYPQSDLTIYLVSLTPVAAFLVLLVMMFAGRKP